MRNSIALAGEHEAQAAEAAQAAQAAEAAQGEESAEGDGKRARRNVRFSGV